MGFLGALLGAAPTVLAGVAKGKRDREETQYTRDQAAMKQMAEENARQQAMAQAMHEFETQRADRNLTRDTQNRQHGELMKHYQTQDRINDERYKAANTRQIAQDETEADWRKAQIALGYYGIDARNNPKLPLVSPTTSAKMAELSTTAKMGDRVTAQFEETLKQHPFLGVTGALDDKILGGLAMIDKLPDDLRQARQGLEMVQSSIRKSMTGLNFTAIEREMLENFLANKNRGDKYNLGQLRSITELIRQKYADLHYFEQASGRDVRGFYSEIPSGIPTPAQTPKLPKEPFKRDPVR